MYFAWALSDAESYANRHPGICAHKHPVPCHLGILRGHKDFSCIMQLYTLSYHLPNRAGFGRGHPEDVRPELLKTSQDMRLEAELWQHCDALEYKFRWSRWRRSAQGSKGPQTCHWVTGWMGSSKENTLKHRELVGVQQCYLSF